MTDDDVNRLRRAAEAYQDSLNEDDDGVDETGPEYLELTERPEDAVLPLLARLAAAEARAERLRAVVEGGGENPDDGPPSTLIRALVALQPGDVGPQTAADVAECLDGWRMVGVAC